MATFCSNFLATLQIVYSKSSERDGDTYYMHNSCFTVSIIHRVLYVFLVSKVEVGESQPCSLDVFRLPHRSHNIQFVLKILVILVVMESYYTHFEGQ